MYRRILVVLLLFVALSLLAPPTASAEPTGPTSLLASYWQTLLSWYQKTIGVAPGGQTSSSEEDPTLDPDGDDKGATIDPDGLTYPPDAGPTVEPNGLGGIKGPTVDPNGNSGTDNGPTVDPNG